MPFNILQNSEKFQSAFQLLGGGEDLDRIVNDIQQYVCLMYGVKSTSSVNEVREIIFCQNYMPKKDNEKFLKHLKSFDHNNIPPCYRVLLQKIKRTQYVSTIWCNADKQISIQSWYRKNVGGA